MSKRQRHVKARGESFYELLAQLEFENARRFGALARRTCSRSRGQARTKPTDDRGTDGH